MSDSFGIKLGIEGEKAFKQSLREINDNFKVLGSEMKLATSNFDKNEKSIESLTATNKVLENQIDEQKNKVKMLKSALDNASESFGENDKRTKNWQTQLNNATADLNKMEREVSNNEKSIDELSNEMKDGAKSADKLGDEIKESGNAAENSKGKFDGLGKGMKGMGKAIGGAVVGLGAGIAAIGASFFGLAESTRETRENIGKLETGFTTAGHSANDAKETYTELFGILGDSGQATEAAAHFAKLTNSEKELADWTNIATGVYATFGDSLPIENLAEAANETAKTGAITGGLADALNWAGVSEDEFQKSLDKCSTEQERQALITETMNGLYSEASEKYKEINGDIINAQKATADFNETMADLGAIAEPIITTLKILVTDLMGEMMPFIEMIASGFSGLIEGTAGAAESLTNGLVGIVELLVGKITEMLPTLLEIGLQILTSIANGIITALPTLVPTVISLVTQITQSITDNLPLILNSALTLITSLAEGLITALPTLVPTIIQIVLQICTFFVDNLPLIIDLAMQIILALADGLIVALPDLIKQVPYIINTFADAVYKLFPQILKLGFDLLVKFGRGIVDNVSVIRENIGQIIKAIINVISLVNLASMGKNLISKFGEGIKSMQGSVKTKIQEIITGIVSKFKSFEWSSIGRNIVQGLWNGIKGMASWLLSNVRSWAGSILSSICNVFDINSPSGETQWVGEMLVDGLDGSVKKNGKKAINSVANMGRGILDTFKALSLNMTDVIPTDFSANVQGSVSKNTGESVKGGFSLVLNIQAFNNYSNEDIRSLTNEIMVTAGEFAKRKEVVFA